MTAAAVPLPAAELSREILILLKDAIGEDDAWLAGAGPDTRLDGDLLLDSIEMAAFAQRLAARYGAEVDLLGHVSSLDVDGIVALSVADVAALVAERRESERPESERHGAERSGSGAA